MSQSAFTGVASGLMSSLLLKAASVYRNPLEALLEYLQNAADEPLTRRIWIILDRENNRIFIGDDGTGMGGPMPTEDRELVDLFYQTIADGQPAGCDLRDLISDHATHTLEWLIRNIANSIKAQGPTLADKMNPALARFMKNTGRKPRRRQRRSTMGQFGIGAWSFLCFAQEMAIYSQPHHELAQALGIQPGISFMIIPPTKEHLSSYQMNFQLQEITEPLLDLYGQQLQHGTIVTISGITPEAWDEITIDNLLTYLRSVFGARIETTGLEILVGEPSGRLEKVEPAVIRGRILVNDVIYSRDGTKCPILITYDPKARDLEPIVTKLGIAICGLSDIRSHSQQLFSGFWRSGRVGGRIAFEHANGDDHLFDTSKHGLLDTPERRFWIKQIHGLEQRIEAAIKEIDAEAQNERLDKAAAALSSTIQRALQHQGISLPHAGDRRRQEHPVRVPSTPPEPAPKNALHHIVVQVVDRNNQGVEGVKVHVKHPPHLHLTRPTGVSGQVQFGRLLTGEYRINIETEHPVRDKPTQRIVIVTDEHGNPIGQRVKFVLEIGEPNRPQSIPKIEVVFNVWDDPGEPWRQSITGLQLIEVNIGPETTLRRELDSEHFLIADGLMAEYTTAALMEALSASGDHLSRITQSALFAEIFQGLQEIRKEGTRTSRKKRT